MSKFVFVLTRGLEDPVRVTRCFQLAKAAKEQGHDVSLFLTDDAAFLMKPGMLDHVVAPTGDEAQHHVAYLLENNVPVFVCTPCAVSRQIKEEELLEGVKFGGAPILFELSDGANNYTF